MMTKIVRWTLLTELGSLLLLALPVFPSAMTNSSPRQAAEQSDLLNLNTATADQLNALPGIGDA